MLFGFSVWGGMLASDSEALTEVRNIGLVRVSTILAGFAATGAPGVALLVAAFFVGPMPDELEERD